MTTKTPLFFSAILATLSLSFLSACSGLQGRPSFFSSTAAADRNLSEDKKVEVVIVGAGLSGLATAYELKKAGISFEILELQPRLGGRVRTVRYDIGGETIAADSGMEEYWESNPAVGVLKELKLPLLHDVALSSMVLDHKLYPLGSEGSAGFFQSIFSAADLKALERFKHDVTPLVEKLTAHKGALTLLPSEMVLKDKPFSEWVKNKLKGHPKVAQWIRVSLECEIGTKWDKISALDGLAEFHIFLGSSGRGEESFRVVGGNDQFTEALASNVGIEQIHLNKKVNGFKHGSDWATSFMDTITNRHYVLHSRYVVSTIPLFRMMELQIEPALSSQKWAAIQTQKWGSYFKAHVFLPATAKHFWSQGENSTLPILSDSALGVIYDGNPDSPSKTKILSLLITGAQAEGFNFMPLDQVRQILKHEFEKLWPGISNEIQRFEFYRYHPRAVASWPVGRSRFDALSEEVRRPENGLFLAGDFTESSHSDGAFLSARRVSRQIIEARGVQ